jgi:hypothetical protein
MPSRTAFSRPFGTESCCTYTQDYRPGLSSAVPSGLDILVLRRPLQPLRSSCLVEALSPSLRSGLGKHRLFRPPIIPCVAPINPRQKQPRVDPILVADSNFNQ